MACVCVCEPVHVWYQVCMHVWCKVCAHVWRNFAGFQLCAEVCTANAKLVQGATQGCTYLTTLGEGMHE